MIRARIFHAVRPNIQIASLELLVQLPKMMASTIPRFLLPRGPYPNRIYSAFALPTKLVPSIPFPSPSSQCPRHASARASSTKTPTSMPRTLEKPEKFNPPSHPQRLNRAPPRNYPGPAMTEQQKQESKEKQYPHMMPPEGSFMHWFLTNKSIHLWISLVCSCLRRAMAASFLLTAASPPSQL